ncbi:MAG: hypothetical protein ACOY5Y_11000 [Pseudomonadota bacterium]
MPATSVSSTSTGVSTLDAIDSGKRWSGEITLNRVDPTDVTELARFEEELPAPYVTDGRGLTDYMWNQVVANLEVLQGYADVTYAITNASDANYFVSDFTNPDNPNNPGIAAEPGNGPILAFNVHTWWDYSDQLQEWIVLHELGHVLGLHHVQNLPAQLDYSQYTIMSYNWYQLGDADYGEGLPLTPMALDVALLQAKYGAAIANATATTYALSNFTLDRDGADGFVQNGGGYICIWDSGGADTIVCAGPQAAVINLNAATLDVTQPQNELADLLGDVAQASRVVAGWSAQAREELLDPFRHAGGFFSSFLAGGQRAPGGYTIAKGAVIEAATGGSGDDLLIGNTVDNLLRGGGGRDDLFGGAGHDSLDGGAGDDAAYGGTDNDTLSGGDGTNYLRGDEGNDSIVGGSGFDDINGNMGNDTCVSGGGDDWVVGGKDNDSLSGSDGHNLVYGNLGNDTCEGGAGNDVVRGGQNDDLINGGAGDDYVSGDKGNDTVTGGTGADLFHTFGDAGLDRVTDFSIAEGDRVLLDPGTQYTVAQSGADTVISMTGGGQMILVGVQMSSLTDGWIFGA